MLKQKTVIIRGAGDLATGVAARVWRSGFTVIMTEIDMPLTVRRTVALSEAVYKGKVKVEDLTACLVEDEVDLNNVLEDGSIPIIVDPRGEIIRKVHPFVVVDAIMAKKNVGTKLDDAPFVIGLGPGFTACEDVHAVIETNRGHNLGRVIWLGAAEANTGVPGEIKGIGVRRVIRSPADGAFRATLKIGDLVNKGEIVGYVGETPVTTSLSGILRGLVHDGVTVQKSLKCGDVDPRGDWKHCYTISDKALAIGGGVLEAILRKVAGTPCRL